MLKSNSKDITFEQLMQQAAQVAKAQDSILVEKAKERKRQEDERRQKEQLIQLEKQKKERALLAKHQAIEARHRQLLEQKQHPIRKPPRPAANDTKTRTPSTKTRTPSTTARAKKEPTGVPAVPVFEKKKPVHMSYEQLMAKAKEVSPTKKSTSPAPAAPKKDAKPLTSRQPKDPFGNSAGKPTASSLYMKRPATATTTKSKQLPPQPSSSSSSSSSLQQMSSRIRSNTQVRTKQRSSSSIEDIRQDEKSSSLPTALHRSRSDTPARLPPPLLKKQSLQRPPIRMPFRRAPDPKRPTHLSQRRPNREYYDDDDDDDDDLDSFIVEDDENDYSSEISKIFRYDRKRYANESVYSDDDMEANSMDVLREEKRSERLARREDQLEEQLEMERQRKRQAKARSK